MPIAVPNNVDGSYRERESREREVSNRRHVNDIAMIIAELVGRDSWPFAAAAAAAAAI